MVERPEASLRSGVEAPSLESERDRGLAADSRDLKGRTIRGGAVTIGAQAAKLVLNTGFSMALARLVAPQEFGLVGMVVAVTGVFTIFRDFGLSAATVQRTDISHQQVSTLFWVNIFIGLGLAGLCVALAPLLTWFYREPRLLGITVALSASILVGAAAVQHQALLRRQMRFGVLALIDISSLAIGGIVGVAMAIWSFGYWAIVGQMLATTVAGTVGTWLATPWRPGRFRRAEGSGALLRFGGFLSGSDLVNYVSRNSDNVLIGWFWGAGPLGIYQKAYALLLLPINQVNSPISSVAVPALSRVQADPQRLRRYFLGGYTMAVSATVPLVLAAVVFAEELVLLLLGPRWGDCVILFRLLAPAALMGAMINPFGWLFVATGRSDRQFRIGVMFSITVVLAFVIALPHGPRWMAVGYSLVMTLFWVPICLFAVRGSSIRLADVLGVLWRPFIAAAAAAGGGLLLKLYAPVSVPSPVLGLLGCSAVAVFYLLILFVAMRQWEKYRESVRLLKG